MSATQKDWVIELPHDHWEFVSSDRVNIEGGALVFSDGDIFKTELVAAFGVGHWVSVAPEDDGCACAHDEDDE